MKLQRPGARPSGDSVNLQLPLLLFTFFARTIFTTPPQNPHSFFISLSSLFFSFVISLFSLHLSIFHSMFLYTHSFFNFSFFSLCHSLISSLSLIASPGFQSPGICFFMLVGKSQLMFPKMLLTFLTLSPDHTGSTSGPHQEHKHSSLIMYGAFPTVADREQIPNFFFKLIFVF